MSTQVITPRAYCSRGDDPKLDDCQIKKAQKDNENLKRQGLVLFENEKNLSPMQPLLSNNISAKEIWKMVKEAINALVELLEGSSESEKNLKISRLELLKKNRIAELNERMKQIEEMIEARDNEGIFKILLPVLSSILAVLTVIVMPATAPIVIATLVLTLATTYGLDPILDAAGVDDPAVRLGIQIAVLVIEFIAAAFLSQSSLPSKIAKIGKMKKLIELVSKLGMNSRGVKLSQQALVLANASSIIAKASLSIITTNKLKDISIELIKYEMITAVLNILMKLLNIAKGTFQSAVEQKIDVDKAHRRFIENQIGILA